jgi:signal transduction histidine kinase
LLVPDVQKETRYVWMQGSSTRSELTVPITIKESVIGVLDVQSDRPDAFDETDLAVIESLAHQAGVALENARLYEQAQQAAVVEERQRLARDLHDAVTQTLFSASLIAEALPATWKMDLDEGEQLLRELRLLSRGALAEMRTLLMELRPTALVESGLDDLLRQLTDAATGRLGRTVQLSIRGSCTLLPADLHVALYRIAQEALNNIVKHARANEVMVDLYCGSGISTAILAARRGESGWDATKVAAGSLELSIRDDGRGFDPDDIPPDRMGLGIMRERAEAIGASLVIESEAGGGTHIEVSWPGRAKAE